MALQTYNDRAVSWANILVTLNVQGGATLDRIDITAIKTGTKIERGEQRTSAEGGKVIKYTDGSASNTVSTTFVYESLTALKRALKDAAKAAGFLDAKGRPQISKVTFDIEIQHDLKDDTTIYHRKIEGVRYNGDDHSDEVGTDVKTIDVEMSCTDISELIDGEWVVAL